MIAQISGPWLVDAELLDAKNGDLAEQFYAGNPIILLSGSVSIRSQLNILAAPDSFGQTITNINRLFKAYDVAKQKVSPSNVTKESFDAALAEMLVDELDAAIGARETIRSFFRPRARRYARD